MTVLFGGDACPLGLSLQIREAPETVVIAGLLGSVVSTATGSTLPMAMEALLPFEAPWTRMLTATVGRWTALVNNFIDGGDLTARGLGCRSRWASGVSWLSMFRVMAQDMPPLNSG